MKKSRKGSGVFPLVPLPRSYLFCDKWVLENGTLDLDCQGLLWCIIIIIPIEFLDIESST